MPTPGAGSSGVPDTFEPPLRSAASAVDSMTSEDQVQEPELDASEYASEYEGTVGAATDVASTISDHSQNFRFKSVRNRQSVIVGGKGDLKELPPEVAQVLKKMRFAGNEGLQLWELEKSAEILHHVKQACDPLGSGKVSAEDCDQAVELLQRLFKARQFNSGEMEYSHLPEQIRTVFQKWDVDGSGTVSCTELSAAAEAWRQMQNESRLLKRLLVAAVVVVLLLLAGMFGMGIATAELAKEFKSTQNGRMVTMDGQVVRVGSADFTIRDGKMVVGDGTCRAGSTGCRRLADGSTTNSLATQTSREQRLLASSLPNSFFSSLKELAVYSDRGHVLSVAVHGFSRVPVLNSRCGNVVTMYTAWGGEVILDDSDLSFDEKTAKRFESAGFSVAVGGAAGRRLASAASVSGFFNHIEKIAGERGWNCSSVPLPTLPPTFVQKEIKYVPCPSNGDQQRMQVCDSRYGGLIPGTGQVPAKHSLATVGRAQRFLILANKASDVRQVTYARTESVRMRTAGWEIQRDRYPNHPGQEKVYLFNRRAKQGTIFQRNIIGNNTDVAYCRRMDAQNNPMVSWQRAEENPAQDTKMHFEFMDIVQEDGVFYRHFRMMPSEVLLQWSGAKPASERAPETYYEYWDRADDLRPYRLVMPEGAFVVFDDTQKAVTDADVERELTRMGLTTGIAAGCPADTPDERNELKPEMLSPMADLTSGDLEYYGGWLQALGANGALTGEEFPEFRQYLERSVHGIVAPTLCQRACATELQRFSSALGKQGASYCDDLVSLVNCFRMAPEPRCGSSKFVLDHTEDVAECTPQQGNQTRRLQDMAAGGSLAFATYDVEMDAAHMTKLPDGSTALDLGLLPDGDREMLAKLLKLPSFARGRLIYNTSSDDEAGGAVLETEDSETKDRRLQLLLTSNCLERFQNTWQFHPIAPSCLHCQDVCIHWGCSCDAKAAKWCYPGCPTTNPRFSAYLKIVMGRTGPSDGRVAVSAGGSLDLAQFLGLPRPLFGSVDLGGEISVSNSRPCSRVPFSFSGSVTVGFSMGISFSLFTWTAISLSLTAGGGMTTYKTNCVTRRVEGGGRRRWWTRRRMETTCNEFCDISVYALAELSANIVLFGVKAWAKIEYYVRHKDVDLTAGVDAYTFFSGWFSVVSHKFF